MVSRRQLLQVGTAAFALPGLALQRVLAVAPSERITVGVIGLGSRGGWNRSWQCPCEIAGLTFLRRRVVWREDQGTIPWKFASHL